MKKQLLLLLMFLSIASTQAGVSQQTVSLYGYKGIWRSDLREVNADKPYWVFRLDGDPEKGFQFHLDKNSYYYSKLFQSRTSEVYMKNDSVAFSYMEVDRNISQQFDQSLMSWLREYYASDMKKQLKNFILEQLGKGNYQVDQLIIHDFMLLPDEKELRGSYCQSEIRWNGEEYVLHKEALYPGLFVKGDSYMRKTLGGFGVAFGAMSNNFSSLQEYMSVSGGFGLSLVGEYSYALKDIYSDVLNVRFRLVAEPGVRFYAYGEDHVSTPYRNLIGRSGHFFALGSKGGAGVVFYRKCLALSLDFLPVGLTFHSFKVKSDFHGNDQYEPGETGYKSKLPVGYLGSGSAGLYFKLKNSWIGVFTKHEINRFKMAPYGVLEEMSHENLKGKYEGTQIGVSWRQHF